MIKLIVKFICLYLLFFACKSKTAEECKSGDVLMNHSRHWDKITEEYYVYIKDYDVACFQYTNFPDLAYQFTHTISAKNAPPRSIIFIPYKYTWEQVWGYDGEYVDSIIIVEIVLDKDISAQERKFKIKEINFNKNSRKKDYNIDSLNQIYYKENHK